MKIQRMIAIMMTICLLMAASAMAEADDPIVVRVGDFTFTRSQLQTAIDTDIEFTELLSQETLTDEERQAQRDDTIERFIDEGLLQCKLREAGQNDFTADEEENLKSAARNLYNQLWQGLWQRAQDSSEDFTEAQITEYLEESGYSIEAIYEEYKAVERRYRAIDLYCPAITLTEDMVREYYETQFLNPDRERYENDIDLYEQEILAQQNESFYTPAGYRAIQQILIEYPDEVNKGLAKEKVQFTQAAKALEAVRKAVVEKREALTMPLIQARVDEIRTAFDAGIDFTSLIGRYSADTNAQNTEKGGYPVHPDSRNWPAEFLEAAKALQKPGDISGPVLTDLGVHILYYASDIPEGEHELTGEERETLNASALAYYQNLELEALMIDWRSEYEIETHPELLDE